VNKAPRVLLDRLVTPGLLDRLATPGLKVLLALLVRMVALVLWVRSVLKVNKVNKVFKERPEQLALRARKDFLEQLEPRALQVLLARQELMDLLGPLAHRDHPGPKGFPARLDRLARLAQLGLLDSRVPLDPQVRKVWLDRQERLVRRVHKALKASRAHKAP
jgi:hypothetical protein